MISTWDATPTSRPHRLRYCLQRHHSAPGTWKRKRPPSIQQVTTISPRLFTSPINLAIAVASILVAAIAIMLGVRTKQVNSYGKRNRRIVDASDNGISGKTEILSIFDDLPPAPRLGGIASKMKRRENVLPLKPKLPSPKVVGMQKKRLSPALSPLRKKRANRIAQLKQEDSIKAKPTISRTGLEQDPIVIVSTSPPRAPLSAVTLNVPGSPAVAHKLRRNIAAGLKPGTPKLNKPFTPFVDVDIIVLDNDGRTLRKERRVSRTDIEVNPINHPPRSKGKEKLREKPAVEALTSDSDSETVSQPKRPRRLARRRAVIVISDDSDSEEESKIPSPVQKLPVEPIRQSNPTPTLPPSRPSNDTSSSLRMEVLVPHAPYPIHLKPQPPESASLVDARASSPSDSISDSDIEILSNPYQHISSLAVKPRQLTPIRGRNRRGLYEPPSPPSPTTPTDFDISLELEQLSIGSDPDDYTQTKSRIPGYLIPLLEECGQELCGPHEFSAFIESFPFDPVIQRDTKHLDMSFRKIGEASYSEVFGIGDVVLKVIPLRDECADDLSAGAGKLNARESQEGDFTDGPAPSDAKDVRKEMIVTRAMGEVYGGFVKLLKTYIVRGRYPEVLLKLWDDYNERKGSESVRPGVYCILPAISVYAIIVLPNGGPDLEAYSFLNASKTGWRQASSLFWQVAKTLGHAERLVSFEHRDLHWGQILVKDLPTKAPPLKALSTNQKLKPKTARLFMDDPTHGVRATVIDLGLSRMDAGDGADGDRVQWTPFDEEVFMGEGDYQFDVYRMMRDHTSGAWEGFHPLTNVMWLHYLVLKLLNSKDIKPPAVSRKTKSITEAPTPAIGAAFSEKDCYDCLVDIEDWLAKCIAEITPVKAAKGKARRKTQAPVKKRSPTSGPACAGEIVEYGAKKGWIKST